MNNSQKVIFLTEIVKKYSLIPDRVIITKMGFCWSATDMDITVDIEDEKIIRKLNKHFDEIIILDVDPTGTIVFKEFSMEEDGVFRKWFTPEQACDYLGISMRQLNKLTKEGYIKEYRPTRKIRRFLKDDLDAFIKNGKTRRGRKPSGDSPL